MDYSVSARRSAVETFAPVSMFASAVKNDDVMLCTGTPHPSLSVQATYASLNAVRHEKKHTVNSKPALPLCTTLTSDDAPFFMSHASSQDTVQMILTRGSHLGTTRYLDDNSRTRLNTYPAWPLLSPTNSHFSAPLPLHMHGSVLDPTSDYQSHHDALFNPTYSVIPGAMTNSHLRDPYRNLVSHGGQEILKEMTQRATYAELDGDRDFSSQGSTSNDARSFNVSIDDDNRANQTPSLPPSLIPKPIVPPLILAGVDVDIYLTPHQAYLRQQIEVFTASISDTTMRIPGRNKVVHLGQVGVRCRHCAHVPPLQSAKGSTFFPISIQGFYQAAQNMCSTHLQCGLCTHMPDSIKEQFSVVLAAKTKRGGSGRPCWTRCAQEMDLVDTDRGVYYRRTVPTGVSIVDLDPNMYRSKAFKKRKFESSEGLK